MRTLSPAAFLASLVIAAVLAWAPGASADGGTGSKAEVVDGVLTVTSYAGKQNRVTVIEADPPRRLVQTWHMLFDPVAEEPFTRLTWEIEGDERGFTRLTVTQEFDGSPNTAVMVSGSDPRTGGGWPFILSDLKTLLETGAPFQG